MTASRPDNEAIFHAARDISDPDRRRQYVREACGGDQARVALVEALLAAADATDSLLDRPLAGPPEATVDRPTTEGPGTVIGPYKLIEPIGEGGMGSVWMAQQTAPVRRLVAVKLIKAGMDSRQVIARFEAERQALALMDHANIARVLDGGTTGGGRPYFVMDLVKGVPITRYCDEHHLTPRQRLELFIPVCQAVQHAHQKGIIHRDLKPSNVLVALYDGRPVPKVIDFGVAKAAGQQLTDKTLVTGFGSIVGTLEYMSPEQAEVNQLDIDTRSDIYALGVLLYELLTGSPPFSRKELTQAGMLEMLRVIREQEPSKPSTKLSTAESLPTLAANRGTEPAKLTKLVRGELDWIVMKALEKDRNRRYETANGFAMDVQRYLADEPVQACPPSAGYRLRKFARRNKGGLAVAALVLFFLALLGSGGGWVVRDRSARGAELREAVAAALDKVTDLRQRARWGEARAVLEQVRHRLGPSGAKDLRRQVERAEADLALVDRLEAARLKASARAGREFDKPSAVREYAAAFREAGIGEETEAAEVVADRIRSSAVREQLVAALDDWAVCVDKVEPARRTWLLAVARAADPDPWRNRFRDAAVWDDRTALERLAREAKVYELSPQILSALGTRLENLDADAIPLLTAAQRRYPSDFWLSLNSAKALQNARRSEEAIGYYRAAMALRPAASGIYNNLGNALRDVGRVDEAIAMHRKAIELDPKFPFPHNGLGNELKDKGRVDEAIAQLRKAIELDPKDAYPHNGLGFALLAKDRVDEAITELRKAIELDPKVAGAHNNLGNALKAKGRVDEAIAEYRKAIELDPKDVYAHFNLGNTLHGKGRVDEAIAEFQKALELDPKYAATHNNLGIALKAKGDLDGAERAFREAVRLDGENHGDAIDELAELLRSRGKLKEAIATYQKSTLLAPNRASGHYRLGSALRDEGRVDKAIAEYQKAIELDPKDVHAHVRLGNALHVKGGVDEAIVEYQKAIELEPRDVHAHIRLGHALHVKGGVDEAIVEYQKAIELAPKFAGAHNDLGHALRDKGRVDEAIAVYQKAIELDPKFAHPHISLGHVLRQKGRVDEAIVEYQKATELDPKDVHTHNILGMALRDNGRVDEAVAEWKKVIVLDPENASAHYHLGIALKAKGDLDEAIAAFEDVIRRQPDFTAAHFGLASALAEAKQWDRSASVYAAALKRFGADLWPGPWQEAIRSDEVFTRLTAQRPEDRLPRIMRARLHVFQRDWKRGAAVYARVYESWGSIDPAKLLPEGGDDLFVSGCLLLLLGDRPGYEQFCKKWADRVGDSPAWAYSLARAWAVSPRPVVPAQQIVERAGKALQASRAPWELHALSLAHYRNGEFERAIERALESNGGDWSESAKALNWIVLAMAHSRLGHAADARKSLELALELAGRVSPNRLPGVEGPDMASPDVVEFELLRREAEELIDPKSKEKPDKKSG